jgi:hypothetical protein
LNFLRELLVYSIGTNLYSVSECIIDWAAKSFSNLNTEGRWFGIKSVYNKNAQRIEIKNNIINEPYGTAINQQGSLSNVTFVGIDVNQSSGLNLISGNNITQSDGVSILVNVRKIDETIPYTIPNSDSNPIYITKNIINSSISLKGDYSGIEVNNSKRYDITGNIIKYTYGYGIKLYDNPSKELKRSKVFDNTITGAGTVPVLIAPTNLFYSVSTGIDVFKSPNVSYCTNTIDNTQIGAQFVNNCDKSSLSKTNFNRHFQALYVGSQAKGWIGEQDRKDNTWKKGLNQTDAIMSSNSITYYSKISIENGVTTYELFPDALKIIAPTNDWFEKSPLSQSNACKLSDPAAPNSEPPSAFERDVIDGNLPNSFNDVQRWEAERSLVEKAINHDYIDPIDGLDVFLDAQNGNDIYIFEHVHQMMDEASKINNSMLEILVNDDEQNFNAVDEILKQALLNDKLSFSDAIRAKLDIVESNEITRTALYNGLDKTRKQILVAALDENFKVHPKTSYAKDEFILNNIEIYNDLYNITEIDEQTLATISEIAAKCPITDGNNVYRARRMLPQCMQTYTDRQCDGIIQIDNELLEGRQVSKSNTTQIYPNPVNNELTLNYVNKIIVSEVSVFDGLGKQIYQVSPNDNIINLKINTNQWSNGIYFVRIQNAQNEVEMHKISVIH